MYAYIVYLCVLTLHMLLDHFCRYQNKKSLETRVQALSAIGYSINCCKDFNLEDLN